MGTWELVGQWDTVYGTDMNTSKNLGNGDKGTWELV